MSAYYNEIDPYAAQWLRNLIGAGLIARGDVDERSIVDVRPDDLAGYTQCHFFAGIAGWSYALRLAGWADDREAWTGSCPCQPLSGVGQRKGHADGRHLWPTFYRLISERRPPVVFGEQVASSDGREWFSAVRSDLEALGYAVGGADLCAAGIGAQHIRQRLWFVADANKTRWADSQGMPAAKAARDIRVAPRVVHRDTSEPFRRAAQPDESWIVDGISGEGFAVGAYGNSIVPQVAAEVIGAYMDVAP